MDKLLSRVRSASLLGIFILSSLAHAGGGSDHTHGPEGDLKTIGIILGAVIVIGIGFHLFNRKK